MAGARSKQPLGLAGGIVFLTLGAALFAGSYVLEIDGMRAAGVALAVLGFVLLLTLGRRKPQAGD